MKTIPELEKKNHIRLSSLNDLEKIQYFGLRKSLMLLFNLLLRKIDKIQNRTTLLSKPIALQLEPTTKCNLRCSFCESIIWDRKGMDMKFIDFKKIIDQFPYLMILLLQGIGEPLMCKDFFKMVSYSKSKRIITGITTNATLLDENIAKKIVKSELDYLIISMDGATSETFERIRVGAKFDQVIKNIRNLVDIRGNLIRPMIYFHFTGTNENIHELPLVVKMAKDIGIEGVEMQDTHFWGDVKLKERIEKETLRQDIDTTKKMVNNAIITAKEVGIQLDLLGTGNRSALYSESDLQLHGDQRLCQKVFRSFFVTVDGYVTTCACYPDPRKQNFGNLLKDDLNSIWNSPGYIAFRKARQKGNIPEYCNMCTVPHL